MAIEPRIRKIIPVNESGIYTPISSGSVNIPANIIKDYQTHDLDEASSPVTYVCKMNNNSDWLILKMDETSELELQYANESNNPTYTTYGTAYTARASLTYEDLDQLSFTNAGVLPVSEVLVTYPVKTPADYYLYQTVATPTISSSTNIDDVVLNVVSSAGVVVDQAITIYEGVNMFQSLVTGITGTTITISSPLDFAFTTLALVECGDWNLAVDGSITPQVYKIKIPTITTAHIHTVNISILDSSDMDDSTFGGLPQLTNGILFRFVDTIEKNLALIVNNIGFWESGFDTNYADKAPAGQYGFKARRDIWKANGTVLQLIGSTNDEFQIHVRDDLTGLDLLACTINGHME